MFLKKLRTALSQLSDEEIYDIAKIARDNLYKKEFIGASIKASHVDGYLKNFIEKNKTSGKYLEAYFDALEEWEPGFVQKVLLGEKVRTSHTWRNILIKITNDVASSKLEKMKDDDYIMKELKILFISTVEACISDDPAETLQTLETLNRVLGSKNNK